VNHAPASGSTARRAARAVQKLRGGRGLGQGRHPPQQHAALLRVCANVQLQVVEAVPVARLQRRQLGRLRAHRVCLAGRAGLGSQHTQTRVYSAGGAAPKAPLRREHPGGLHARCIPRCHSCSGRGAGRVATTYPSLQPLPPTRQERRTAKQDRHVSQHFPQAAAPSTPCQQFTAKRSQLPKAPRLAGGGCTSASAVARAASAASAPASAASASASAAARCASNSCAPAGEL